MANQQDLDFTYTTIDEIFRLSIGERGDFSGAMYNGDFTLSLEEAQATKHRYIIEQLGVTPQSRVIDLGCGWGPFLHYASEHVGAQCVGLTLSEGQQKACQKNGFEVYLKDCKAVSPDDYGTFDAALSIGAFEHFCSVEDYLAGRQEAIYQQFFQTVHDLLPAGGRFYLQTMVFGPQMIDYDDIDLHAPEGSTAYMLALMIKEFPGSWLPYGLEMVQQAAKPYFRLVEKSSGRLDYIETISQWRKKFRAFHFRKYLLYLQQIPRYFTDPEFRHRLAIFQTSPNRVCFERHVMDHFRMVWERKG